MCLISDLVCGLAIVYLLALASQAQTTPPVGPNSDPVYQQLRNIGLGSEAVSVTNLELKRDAAIFDLHSGTVCFVAPVQGKVTGALFVGDGNMVLDPPIPIEKASLRLLTREDEFVEQYERLVLRFTDSTYEEIKKEPRVEPAMPDSFVTARMPCDTTIISNTTWTRTFCRTCLVLNLADYSLLSCAGKNTMARRFTQLILMVRPLLSVMSSLHAHRAC